MLHLYPTPRKYRLAETALFMHCRHFIHFPLPLYWSCVLTLSPRMTKDILMGLLSGPTRIDIRRMAIELPIYGRTASKIQGTSFNYQIYLWPALRFHVIASSGHFFLLGLQNLADLFLASILISGYRKEQKIYKCLMLKWRIYHPGIQVEDLNASPVNIESLAIWVYSCSKLRLPVNSLFSRPLTPEAFHLCMLYDKRGLPLGGIISL